MVGILERIFLKNKKLDQAGERQVYGILCGALGIFLNVLLFAGKFLAGTISHSIAITADAFNNLSDAGSSIITLLGFKLAGSKPDPSHPFGHGRIEYLSGLAVAASILLMAFELIKDSIDKILHPSGIEFSMIAAGILIVSIFVKAYMAYYNRHIADRIDSAAMRATSTDSFSDMIATTVVLLSSVIGHFSGWNIDGYCGVLVGLFILSAGIGAAKDTLNPLLGQSPSREYVKEIEQIVMAHQVVQGIHDLIVHDYGPGRKMITLHAEVPAEGNILKLHDEIDLIEMELREKLGCLATIHMDPIVTEDESVRKLKEQVSSILKNIDERLTMHDFRMVTGPTHTNLIFDVMVPYGFGMDDGKLGKTIDAQVKKEIGETYFVVINVDISYT